MLLPCLVLIACSTTSTSPIDFMIPTPVPLGMEQVLDHEVPNIKGFTSLGILKGARQEMMIKMKIDAALYNIAMEQSNLFIQAGDSAANNVLGFLAAAGLGAGPVGFLAGAKRKRQGDLSPEEHQVAIQKAKLDAIAETKLNEKA